MIQNKAIGFLSSVTADDIHYTAREVAMPQLNEHDVLVRVLATSVNPVDLKMQSVYSGSDFRVLGFDGVGEVVNHGSSQFAIGDKIYYAGQQLRAGANQLYQAVDSRLVAKIPSGLTAAEAAALPLTSITAFEILTDSLGLTVGEKTATGKDIFIINGAGGVGSILIQLAKVMGMRVITTASRPETMAWTRELGADVVLNHRKDLEVQLTKAGIDKLSYIAILHSTDHYWPLVLKHIAPFGRISSIVETTEPINMGPLKNIGAQFSWVFMFAKGNFGVCMEEQGSYLKTLSALIEAGKIHSTLAKVYEGFSVENLEAASRDVASGRLFGKVIIEYKKNAKN